MLYREIGQTGCQVSQLGFGCMRLRTEDGTVEMMNPNKAVDQQLATRLIHHAMDCGVNYFDTAYPYLGGQSETVLGKALQEGRRQKVFLTTKLPLEENINVASDATPNTLTEEELVLFDRVKAFYGQRIKVDCTGCGYCMPCPEGVNIPGNFSAYNQLHMFDEPLAGRMIPPEQRADACKECGECEDLCPQKLPIRELLKDVATELPAGGLPPMPPLQEKH